jgi:phosphotransferase system HPr-like phosphotransfer protein
MKKKNLLLIGTALFLFISFSAPANAAWHVCYVLEAGLSANTGIVFVKLDAKTDSESTWTGGRWFTASGTDSKSVLAVALTAVSNGTEVTVNLTNTTEYTLMQGLFCRNQ